MQNERAMAVGVQRRVSSGPTSFKRLCCVQVVSETASGTQIRGNSKNTMGNSNWRGNSKMESRRFNFLFRFDPGDQVWIWIYFTGTALETNSHWPVTLSGA